MSDQAVDLDRVLFIGIGASPVCYYRCMLPALAMGADWVGLSGIPPRLMVDTGLVKGKTAMPNLLGGDYDVVVIQQPFGDEWRTLIEKMKDRGTKVIFEIDDYLHAIRHLPDHDYRHIYDAQRLRDIELAMQECDAMIVSTPWLKRKYSKFNEHVYVCPNGINMKRYELEMPERGDAVNIGWAGATGHINAITPWLHRVSQVMAMRDNTTFVSIGQRFADAFKPHFGRRRALSVPFAAIEQYPAAMTLFDIALAPAGHTRFHRGKSDLRWVEASALGIPVIADPVLYPDIEQGVTGFKASNPEQMTEYLLRLIDDKELRQTIGVAAREHIREHRTIQVLKRNWEQVFEKVVAGK